MLDPMLIGTLAPFVVAPLAPLIARRLGRHAGWALALAPAGIFAWFAQWLPVLPGEVHTSRLSWVPDLGVELAFLADGLSITFVLLITGIGTLVLVYAGGYLGNDPRLGRFYGFILAFMGAMLGVVLADNVITLFVFWELTSVCSYLLIGFDHETESGRASALKALLITAAGGLLLLAGLILLMIAGSQLGLAPSDAGRISALATVDVRGHALYPAIFVLLFLGCATKSAQIPFHFWLPAAMAGPTPVSAYLHSATMVKAGVYLLARMHPILGGTWLWNDVVTVAGLLTMLLGAIATLGQKDLKRILAYSTLAVLGTLVMLIGVGNEMAIKTAVVYLVAHALYKASLFMVAGNVDHETGTRDVTVLGGLRRWMPLTAAAGLLAALSKAGAPPMFGFIGKELLYKTKITLDNVGAWLVLAAVVANVALVASALMVSVRPFLGASRKTPKKPHEAPLAMVLPPVLLALFGLARGLQPEPFENSIGSAAASAILGETVTMKLKLWHGVDPLALSVLALSFLTLAAGFGLYQVVKRRLAPIGQAMHALERIGPARLYEISLDGLNRGAGWVTRVIQTGSLRRYVFATLVVALIAVAIPLLRDAPAVLDAGAATWRLHEIVVALLIVGGAVLAVSLRSRLAAVAAVGVTGLMVAVIFVLFSAPDLAMTQIVAETLAVILLVLVFYHLPAVVRRSRWPARVRDMALAGAVGAVMTGLVLAVAPLRPDKDVSDYFLAASQPAAHGLNVVNVILVDFRALDTLGEVTVLVAAGLGVFALLRLRPDGRGDRP
ncbi:MAG: putative monovalent cation/H+ antiporter subunit A [Acidobacteriota bacterium]|nr:putative monovalent cation/H+ antiporter subunit A [Acidobacteriota bacterium]